MLLDRTFRLIRSAASKDKIEAACRQCLRLFQTLGIQSSHAPELEVMREFLGKGRVTPVHPHRTSLE